MRAKRERIFRDHPELAAWWIEAEAEAEARPSKPSGARFRIDTPSYAQLKVLSEQPMLPFDPEDLDRDPTDLGDCVCNAD